MTTKYIAPSLTYTRPYVPVIARERLGVIKQLSRFNQEMRELDHFRDSMHGKAITRFADRLHGRLQQEKELKQIVHKFDFEPDPAEKINLTNLLLRDEAGDGEEGGGAIEGEDIAKVWTSKDLNKQRVQLQKTTFEQCMAEKRNRRRPFWDKAVLGSRKKKTFQRDRNGFIRNLGGGGGGGEVDGGRRMPVGMFGPPLEQNGGSTTTEEENATPSGESEGGGEVISHNGESSGENNGDPVQHIEENGETAAAAELTRVPHPPEEEYDDGPRRPYGPFKSPRLPALHNLRKLETIKVRGRGGGRRRRDRIHPSLSDRNSASMDYLPLIKGTRGQHGVFTSPLDRTEKHTNGKTAFLPEVTKPNPGVGLPTISES